jgi:hypothetical protein
MKIDKDCQMLIDTTLSMHAQYVPLPHTKPAALEALFYITVSQAHDIAVGHSAHNFVVRVGYR